ncbi:MAG: hypothetical protein KGS47_16890, partial [Chloroflexi bacterium]|nr:hypothetical protein [Chloroflexota bacterium]
DYRLVRQHAGRLAELGLALGAWQALVSAVDAGAVEPAVAALARLIGAGALQQDATLVAQVAADVVRGTQWPAAFGADAAQAQVVLRELLWLHDAGPAPTGPVGPLQLALLAWCDAPLAGRVPRLRRELLRRLTVAEACREHAGWRRVMTAVSNEPLPQAWQALLDSIAERRVAQPSTLISQTGALANQTGRDSAGLRRDVADQLVRRASAVGWSLEEWRCLAALAADRPTGTADEQPAAAGSADRSRLLTPPPQRSFAPPASRSSPVQPIQRPTSQAQVQAVLGLAVWRAGQHDVQPALLRSCVAFVLQTIADLDAWDGSRKDAATLTDDFAAWLNAFPADWLRQLDGNAWPGAQSQAWRRVKPHVAALNEARRR